MESSHLPSDQENSHSNVNELVPLLRMGSPSPKRVKVHESEPTLYPSYNEVVPIRTPPTQNPISHTPDKSTSQNCRNDENIRIQELIKIIQEKEERLKQVCGNLRNFFCVHFYTSWCLSNSPRFRNFLLLSIWFSMLVCY